MFRVFILFLLILTLTTSKIDYFALSIISPKHGTFQHLVMVWNCDNENRRQLWNTYLWPLY